MADHFLHIRMNVFLSDFTMISLLAILLSTLRLSSYTKSFIVTNYFINFNDYCKQIHLISLFKKLDDQAKILLNMTN